MGWGKEKCLCVSVGGVGWGRGGRETCLTLVVLSSVVGHSILEIHTLQKKRREGEIQWSNVKMVACIMGFLYGDK